MNGDTITGTTRDIGGKIKEEVGSATGNGSLQGEGLADQLTGKAQQAYGTARDAVAGGVGPLADKARGFARERPFAAAALAGVIGIALINTLRGKK